jgi:signal peptidase I
VQCNSDAESQYCSDAEMRKEEKRVQNQSKKTQILRCFSKLSARLKHWLTAILLRRNAAILLSAILPLCLLWAVVSQTRLQTCSSESLKGIRAILVMRNLTLKRGDIVSIEGHDTAYVKGKRLVKRVIGLPGDQIVIKDGEIMILPQKMNSEILERMDPKCKEFEFDNVYAKSLEHSDCLHRLFHEWLKFPLLDQTTGGDPLTPLSAKIIPEGALFVLGDHPHSFDSRYEEFGLVPVDKIWGKAILKW